MAKYWILAKSARLLTCSVVLVSMLLVRVGDALVGSGAAGDKNLISAVVIEIEEANLLGECEVMTWRQAAPVTLPPDIWRVKAQVTLRGAGRGKMTGPLIKTQERFDCSRLSSPLDLLRLHKQQNWFSSGINFQSHLVVFNQARISISIGTQINTELCHWCWCEEVNGMNIINLNVW